MKLLFITHTPIDDRSYGGAIRANAVRDALIHNATVDTIIINGGPFAIDVDWRPGRLRFVGYGQGRAGLLGRLRVRRWIEKLVRHENYDAIVVQYIDLALLLPRSLYDRTIFDADDFRKTAPPGASFATRLKYVVRNAAAEWITAQVRHSWLVNPGVNQRPKLGVNSVLPNIVPLPAADRTRRRAVAGRILMVGLMKHAPNIEGLAWFHANVWPILKENFPAASFEVIGRYAEGLPSRFADVEFRGFVSNLEPEYDAAELVVAPIFTGAGTQIKILDALGHGRPLVTSRFAAAGFAPTLRHDEHLLVADDAASWITLCSAVLSHEVDAGGMAKRGEASVRLSYGQHVLNTEVKRTLTAMTTG